MPAEPEMYRVRAAARQLYSSTEVDERIRRMAADIAGEIADLHPVVLAVMRGGAFTAVRLCGHFQFPYEFDYIDARRYGRNLSGGELTWRVRPDEALRGRTVLLVDDVLDRGVTVATAHRHLLEMGVVRCYVAVLVSKQVTHAGERLQPDFVAIQTGDEYLFGCGMDYKGYWRGLPALYAVDADD
jgi:hypoxanthine phosphoribosyltransferase